MSHFTSGLIGAAVATLAFGAAQFAMGSDIAGAKTSGVSQSVRPVNDVNRSTKSDRVALATGAASASEISASRTVAVSLLDLPATSVLIRIPATVLRKDAITPQNSTGQIKSTSASPTQTSPGRRQVACEPVVSVLTDVAKSLQPGRCVT